MDGVGLVGKMSEVASGVVWDLGDDEVVAAPVGFRRYVVCISNKDGNGIGVHLSFS